MKCFKWNCGKCDEYMRGGLGVKHGEIMWEVVKM